MEDNTVEFDAADLADDILGIEDPAAPPWSADLARHTPSANGPNIGMILATALFFAIGAALLLAFYSGDGNQPQPPPCGGLYDQCCDERQLGPEPWPAAERGLFDAEEDFADRSRLPARPHC